MKNIRVKICCISSQSEAQKAIGYGAAALGLVGKMPSGPGVIDDELIKTISANVPPPVATFLLTSETRAVDIVAHYKKVGTTTIQLVDAIPANDYSLIRHSLPHVKLVQVIHVINKQSIDEALEVAQYADALLLDSGNPNLAIKQLGGTGRTHNWVLSRKIREQIKIPLFLAGGIGAHNVAEAIETVEPFGIDLCSSVRTNGLLDEHKLAAFFKALV